MIGLTDIIKVIIPIIGIIPIFTGYAIVSIILANVAVNIEARFTHSEHVVCQLLGLALTYT